MLDESIGHEFRVLESLLAEGRVGSVRILLGRSPGPHEVCRAGLDLQVGEVENDAVREVTEADVVVRDLLSSVDHLDAVKLFLFHCLIHGDPRFDALQIQLRCIIGIHSFELISGQYPRRTRCCRDTDYLRLVTRS